VTWCSHSAALGQVAVVPDEPFDRYIISQSQMKLTVDPAKADPLYVYYAFATHDQQEHIRLNAIQTGVPHTNLTILRNTPIELPSLREQQDVVAILGALDDKIELNRWTSETLEAMARALFKSWFVDLDPVRVKASALIRDGVLEIGDGYRAKNDELGAEGLPFIRAADLNNGFDTHGADRLRSDRMERAGNKTSRVGDVAFTSKGTIGRFARVGETTEQFVYSPQVCYWRSLDPERMHPAILYCWMQSEELRAQIMAVAGQTDMAPYVSLKDQRDMMVPVFPDSQRVIGNRLALLLARTSVAQAESRTLTVLRDTLLPRLISGELRVPAAERLVAQAV
jgi:type I restriction enzyme, S subunit